MNRQGLAALSCMLLLVPGTYAAAQIAGDRTFGKLMLDVRRAHLRSNDPPLSLALKTYGDARWKF